MKTTKTGFAAMALGLLLAAPLSAQLPSASTPGLGMGDNFTAVARGYHAIAWNPALLGLSGNPGASLALAPVRAVAGLDPISLKDFKDYEGVVVPANVKAQWLADVTSEGSEQGTGGFDATAIAVQIGKFGFQASTRARAVANLGPGAVRLLLYGNADENGVPQNITLAGSELNAFWTSTFAGSFALPFKLSNGGAAIGATVKYTIGHMMLTGQDNGSQLTSQPSVSLKFPTVSSVSEDAGLNNGGGIGVDLGFALQRENLTVSATLQNLLNTFEWKTDNLFFRPGEAIFNSTTKESNFTDTTYAAAPQLLKDLVEDLKYKPTLAVGLALTPTNKLTLAADVRSKLGDGGIEENPKFHAGAGIEYKLLSFLPLRAGAAAISGGFQYGGGLGLDLGPFNLGASLLRRDGDLGKDVITMFTLISTGR